MNEKINGGQAFPRPSDGGIGSRQDGMTLRDYFAAKALQGILTGANGMRLDQPPCDLAATVAYLYADAMLAARAKGG